MSDLFTFKIKEGTVNSKLVSGNSNLLGKILSVKNPKADKIKWAVSKKGGAKAKWIKDWDGYQHYLKRPQNTFPSGLLYWIDELAKANGIEDKITLDIEQTDNIPTIKEIAVPDDILEPGKGRDKFKKLREYQVDTVAANLSCHRGIALNATNAGKTEMMCAMLRLLFMNYYEGEVRPVLLLVSGKTLLHQTAKRVMKRLPMYAKEVGMLGDKSFDADKNILVATGQMLTSRLHSKKKEKRKQILEILKRTQILFLDECHHGKSSSWMEISNSCGAPFRYGFSGTPITTAGVHCINNVNLAGVTGGILSEITNEFMMEKGYSARVRVVMVPVGENDHKAQSEVPTTTPQLGSDCFIVKDGLKIPAKFLRREVKERKSGDKIIKRNTGYSFVDFNGDEVKINSSELLTEHYFDKYKVGYPDSNKKLCAWAKVFKDCKYPTLTILSKVVHGKLLEHRMNEMGIRAVFLWGKKETKERDKALSKLSRGTIDNVICTSIFDEGVDVPDIKALLLGTSGESYTKSLQRIGRGIRQKKDGENVLWVVDTIDYQCDFLLQDSATRLDYYENEKFEIFTDADATKLFFSEHKSTLKEMQAL